MTNFLSCFLSNNLGLDNRAAFAVASEPGPARVSIWEGKAIPAGEFGGSSGSVLVETSLSYSTSNQREGESCTSLREP